MNLPVTRGPDAILVDAAAGVTDYLEQAKPAQIVDMKAALEAKGRAATFRIVSEGLLHWAGSQVQGVLRHKDEIEAARTRITKPLNDLLKKVNGAFMPRIKEWEQTAELLKMEILRYQREREAAAELARVAAQHLAQSTSVIGETPVAQTYQALVAQGSAPTASAGDGVYGTSRMAWDVVDIDLVPPELVVRTANKERIDQIMAATNWAAQIPGIRVYRHDNIAVRR